MRKYQALHRNNDDDEDTEAWMLTYGDLMTQLLCFFILLLSFSTVSSMKFKEVIVSLREALAAGVLPSARAIVDGMPSSVKEMPEGDELLGLKSAFDEHIEKHNMSAHVETEIRKEGLVVILKQSSSQLPAYAGTTREPPVFFDTADARIKEKAYRILGEIGGLLKDLPNDVRVAGHTDNRPINTPQFSSNWELSTTRATNVLRYLHEVSRIVPERLSAAGYGPYRPIAPNDAEHGMSRNRRVEIIILRMEEGNKGQGSGVSQQGIGGPLPPDD